MQVTEYGDRACLTRRKAPRLFPDEVLVSSTTRTSVLYTAWRCGSAMCVGWAVSGKGTGDLEEGGLDEEKRVGWQHRVAHFLICLK